MWFGCAVLLLAPAAADTPVVVVRESPQVSALPEFVVKLRVQVGGAAEVRLDPEAPSGTLGDKLAQASALIDGARAWLVVWIELVTRTEAQATYVVYVVGNSADRAVVEVIRIPARLSPDVARVMALKVGSLVDLLISTRRSKNEVAVTTAAVQSEATPSAKRAYHATWLIQAGADGLWPTGDVAPQAGALFGLGRRYSSSAWQLATHGRVRWRSPLSNENRRGTVEIDELAAGLGAGGARRFGRLWLGIDAELGSRIIHARGKTSDGQHASAIRLVPLVRVALTTAVALHPRLDVELALGMDTALWRQRFSLANEPAVDLGRYRPCAELRAVWRIP